MNPTTTTISRPTTPLESLLTPIQTKIFADYLTARVESIAAQLSADFFPKRDTYARQMEDDFSWRTGSGTRDVRSTTGLDDLAGDIFDLQNDSLNIVGGFASFMTARTADDIFGTDPYYALNPEGIEDRDLAEDLQKHSEWKLRQSTFKDAALDALDLAMGLGEGILKIHWHRDVDVFEREAHVLHRDGEPVLTATGEYVFPEDFPALPCNPSASALPSQESGVSGQGSAVTRTSDPDTDLRAYLSAEDPHSSEHSSSDIRHSEFPTPSGGAQPISNQQSPISNSPTAPALSWQRRAIEQTNVSYSGIRASTMHYRDFLCPLTADDVAEADFVGHRFQMCLSEATHRFGLRPALVAQLRAETDDAKAERDLPRPGETAEHPVTPAEPDPIIEFVECWVRHDPVGDGRLRRIYALLIPSLSEIVEMDYIANRTPGGQLPFFVIRAYKMKNRWYGRGYYETYGAAQEYIDRQLNRIEYRNRFHSNPAVFVNHKLLAEDEDSGDFELRPGRTFLKKTGAKMEDIIEAWAFPDLDERTWQLMQFMIQIIQVRSGITSAAQGEISNLPSSATATGIESIMQSASVLARLPMGQIRASLERALLYAVKLIYANFDRDEVFTYFEGDEQRARTLQAARLQNLDLNVRLLLTRFKQRDSLDSATKAIDIHARYVALPEPEKSSARPLFVQALKGLGFDQADSIIRQPAAADPSAPPVPPGVAALPPAPPATPASVDRSSRRAAAGMLP